MVGTARNGVVVASGTKEKAAAATTVRVVASAGNDAVAVVDTVVLPSANRAEIGGGDDLVQPPSTNRAVGAKHCVAAATQVAALCSIHSVIDSACHNAVDSGDGDKG